MEEALLLVGSIEGKVEPWKEDRLEVYSICLVIDNPIVGVVGRDGGVNTPPTVAPSD